MRGQTRYLLHCVKRITLASAGKENSTELMFAPHPSPLPWGEGEKQSAFCFTGGAEHHTKDSLSPGEREKNRVHFVLRKEQNIARAIPSPRGRGRKAERIFVLREEQNTARAIPSPVREVEKQSAFLFYGKSRTPHERFPLSVGEGESRVHFVLREEQNTAHAIPSPRGRGLG